MHLIFDERIPDLVPACHRCFRYKQGHGTHRPKRLEERLLQFMRRHPGLRPNGILIASNLDMETFEHRCQNQQCDREIWYGGPKEPGTTAGRVPRDGVSDRYLCAPCLKKAKHGRLPPECGGLNFDSTKLSKRQRFGDINGNFTCGNKNCEKTSTEPEQFQCPKIGVTDRLLCNRCYRWANKGHLELTNGGLTHNPHIPPPNANLTGGQKADPNKRKCYNPGCLNTDVSTRLPAAGISSIRLCKPCFKQAEEHRLPPDEGGLNHDATLPPVIRKFSYRRKR